MILKPDTSDGRFILCNIRWPRLTMQTLVSVGFVRDRWFGFLVPHWRYILGKWITLILFIGMHFSNLSVRSDNFWFGRVLIIWILGECPERHSSTSINKANSSLLQVKVWRVVFVCRFAYVSFLLHGGDRFGFRSV